MAGENNSSISGCETYGDCLSYLSCRLDGYCHCGHIGYVKNILNCFKNKKYHTDCFFTTQCEDYRMNCEPNNSTDVWQITRCLCDDFQVWNSTAQECSQITNITNIVSTFGEEIDRLREIESESQRVVKNMLVTGLIVISIILSSILITFLVYCHFFRVKNKRTTPEEKEAQMKDGVGVDYIPALTNPTYSHIDADFT